MEMVGADWLRSDKREDDLAGRPGSLVKVWIDYDYTVLNYDISQSFKELLNKHITDLCRDTLNVGVQNSSSL